MFKRMTIAVILASVTVGSTASAQSLRNETLITAKNLLSGNLPDDCGVDALSELNEMGFGKSYKGRTLLIGLNLNGAGTSIAIPYIDIYDRDSASVTQQNHAITTEGGGNKSITLTRNYQPKEKENSLKHAAGALGLNSDIEKLARTKTDSVRIFFTAGHTVSGLQYTAKDNNDKIILSRKCGHIPLASTP